MLKYLSNLLGVSMDRIVNWLLLIIIFVFDPLAISLVVAANFAFAQLRSKNEYPIEEKVEDMRKVVDAYDTLEDEIRDWDPTLNDGLEDEPHHFLDLDKDGIVEEEEVQQVLKQMEKIGTSFDSADQWRKNQLLEEIQKLRDMITSNRKREDNDTTKTYF